MAATRARPRWRRGTDPNGLFTTHTLGDPHGIFTPQPPTFTGRSRRPTDTDREMSVGTKTLEPRPATPPASPAAGTSLQPPGRAYLVKRAVLGPALPTARLKHERLGKPTALAVFASDNLSSSAYATEEILKVAVPAVGATAFGLVMPITFAILIVLGILLFSYRQTIRAYPSAGGAYIVTKDNFGLLPAQLAGVALLTDYVLTVSVSVAAGIAAITSAFPATHPYRVWMSVVAIWFIAWGNLRGVRESGRMFMVPTYFFIAMMFTLLGVGIYRALAGDLHPLPAPPDALPSTAGTVGIFLVLHAFASGGAAVTGVEAISNGIPAFRPPEWRNARTTLMWMGGLLGVMFLGLSFLAVRLHALPTETMTLNSQIARAVFDGGAFGTALFLLLQIGTTLILILAANTSFADFPRLANFQATDQFLPKQLTTRGHRLVFSNGVIGLALAASVLVVAFGADVHRLIPLYAIGVFTSFTLSQAGMAKRHLRLREPGWRRGLVVNGIGAVTTAVVDVVIAITKFAHGAWAVILFVPILVWLLVRMNHRYGRERAELEGELEAFGPVSRVRPITVLLVEDLDRKTLHALQYARTIRSVETVAVHIEKDPGRTAHLQSAWEDLGFDETPLRVLRGGREPAAKLAGYVGSFPPGVDVNVVVPGPASRSFWDRLRHGPSGARFTKALRGYENVRVTLVRDHPGPGHPVVSDAPGHEKPRLSPRARHKVVVLVEGIDRASLAAIRYAASLDCTEARAVHAAVDPTRAEELGRAWMEQDFPFPLDVIECWDRDVARATERYVVELATTGSEVTVLLPRRDYAQLRQRVLHDRTSRAIARALGRYPHVDLTVVPYFLRRPAQSRVTSPVTAAVGVSNGAG